ncbi:Dynein heavy chain, cytoplasmic, partial [Aduncisulcus paluster]
PSAVEPTEKRPGPNVMLRNRLQLDDQMGFATPSLNAKMLGTGATSSNPDQRGAFNITPHLKKSKPIDTIAEHDIISLLFTHMHSISKNSREDLRNILNKNTGILKKKFFGTGEESAVSSALSPRGDRPSVTSMSSVSESKGDPLITIDVAGAHEEVLLKLGEISRDICKEIAGLYDKEEQDACSRLSSLQTSLESLILDQEASTEDLVYAIKIIGKANQDVKRDILIAEMLNESYALLSAADCRDMINNPPDKMLNTNLDNVKIQLTEKHELLKTNFVALSNLLSDANKKLSDNALRLIEEWKTKRPENPRSVPHDAITTCDTFHSACSAMISSCIELEGGWTYLSSCSLSTMPVNSLTQHSISAKLNELLDDAAHYRAVWLDVKKAYDKREIIGDKIWHSISADEIKAGLGEIRTLFSTFPATTTSEECFRHAEAVVNNLSSLHVTLCALKESFMKKRHWILLSKLTATPELAEYDGNSLTVERMWHVLGGCKGSKGDSHAQAVIIKAQGEFALERFMRGVERFWSVVEFEFTEGSVTKGGVHVRLIKNWEELSAKLDEDLADIGSMKNSPYYAEFRKEATEWEERLQSYSELFDLWAEVQRRWLHLQSVTDALSSTPELREEAQSLRQSNATFVRYMSTTCEYKLVQTVGVEMNPAPEYPLLKGIEELGNRLKKVQQALGAFLANQRAIFARFFFVGDEDLLEMLGAVNDVRRLQRHMQSMFAGISSLVVEDIDGVETKPAKQSSTKRQSKKQEKDVSAEEKKNILQQISALASSEGEILPLCNPIPTHGFKQTHQLLSCVEGEMRRSFRVHMHSCIQDLRKVTKEMGIKGSGWYDEAGSKKTSSESPAIEGSSELSATLPMWCVSHLTQCCVVGVQVRVVECVEEMMEKEGSKGVESVNIWVRKMLSVLADPLPGEQDDTATSTDGEDGIEEEAEEEEEGSASDHKNKSVSSVPPSLLRRRRQLLLTELIRLRDLTDRLSVSMKETELSSKQSQKSSEDIEKVQIPFMWQAQMRHYLIEPSKCVNYNEKEFEVKEWKKVPGSQSLFDHIEVTNATVHDYPIVAVRVADTEFTYGYEWWGSADRLVQTPLTDKCFLILTQALAQRKGGSPAGPAGTGKTESVKMLAQHLGRLCQVVCCDENFDANAVSRTLSGLCACGAFGCYDEFNRLD